MEPVRPSRMRFLAGMGASLVGASAPSSSLSTSPAPSESAIEAAAAAVPGRVAVFAQRVCDAAPAVAIGATAIFPAASVIKLAIMLAVYRAIDATTIATGTRVPFRTNEIVGGSETFGSARPGKTASVRALLAAMIRQSDNTASNALVDALGGFTAINEVIEQAGLRHTRLRRYFLHFSSAHENTTTATDIGALLLAIERDARGAPHPVASQASCRAMIDTLLGQEDREKIARGLPRGVPLANKTGELPGVRHDAGIIDPYGAHPYVLVVLEANLRDQTQGVVGINRISSAVHRAFAARQNCK